MQVYNSSVEAARYLIGGPFSGQTVPAKLTSASGVLLLTFVSDASIHGLGFSASFGLVSTRAPSPASNPTAAGGTPVPSSPAGTPGPSAAARATVRPAAATGAPSTVPPTARHGPCKGAETLTGTEGSLSSGEYSADSQCTWLIAPAGTRGCVGTGVRSVPCVRAPPREGIGLTPPTSAPKLGT